MVRPFSPYSISCKYLIPWVVLALLAGEGAALAKLSLSVSPPLVDTTLVPGGVIRFTVTITNEGDEDARVTLHPVTFELSPEGEVVFLEGGPYSLLPWMTTKEKSAFFLRAGEKKEILFDIRAPRGARGGCYGAVLFEALPVDVSFGMAVGIRMGTLVLATLPRSSGARGKIKKIRLESGKIEVEVENVGNVHFAVTEAEAVVRAESGRVLRRITLGGAGLILPGGVRLLQGELEEGVLPEACTLEVRVFTQVRNRRLLLDRLSVPYFLRGGEERREEKVAEQ